MQIMKKIILLLMVIFLASCATDNSQNSQTLTNEQNPATNISTTSEARKIVETMAEHMRKNSSDIQETNYKFFDIFETHSDEFYRKGVNLHAYSVHSDLIDYETLEKMNAENFLDGWVRHYGPDGIVGYSMKYSYENIICSADAVLKNVDERFQEIFYDDENNLNSEEEEKIFASRRYEYTFSCADKPDTLVGLTDLMRSVEVIMAHGAHILKEILFRSVFQNLRKKNYFLSMRQKKRTIDTQFKLHKISLPKEKLGPLFLIFKKILAQSPKMVKNFRSA